MLDSSDLSNTEIGKRLSQIPTDDISADFEVICKHASTTGRKKEFRFKDCFEPFQRCHLESAPTELLENTFGQLLKISPSAGDALKLFNLVEKHLPRHLWLPEVVMSKYVMDLMILRLQKNSDDVNDAIPILSAQQPLKAPCRMLRQAMFRFCALRKEVENCWRIITSIPVRESSTNFLEFSTYCASYVPLIVNDDRRSRDLFNLVMNLATTSKRAEKQCLLSFALSIAPLVPVKSVHPASLDFVKSQDLNPGFAHKFEMATESVRDNLLPLYSAPALLRPYHLCARWTLNPKNIGEMKNASDVYNTLLRLCRQKPNSACEIVKQLPLNASLPFFYLLVNAGHEDEFHGVVKKLLMKSDLEAIEVLERCGRTFPGLVKPHIASIEKLGIVKSASIVASLIKADVVDFRKLWVHVQNQKFHDVKSIVREGIVQIQRKSKTIDNTNFILRVLRHFFSDVRGCINWTAVAGEFSDDQDIVGTILLSENSSGDKNTSVSRKMMKWRESFIRYFERSRGESHMCMATPLLLLITGETNIPRSKVKLAVSLLPNQGTMCEAILDGFAIYELSRNVLVEAKGAAVMAKLEEIFDFRPTSDVTYPSLFIHAALATVLGAEDSAKRLLDIVRDGKDQFRVHHATIALNIMRINNYLFKDEQAAVFKTLHLVDHVLSLLVPTAKQLPTLDLDRREEAMLSLLKSTHEMVEQDVDAELKHTSFRNYEELRKYFLKMSVACYLLLPTRSIGSSSVDKCVSLLVDSVSTNDQKKFAIAALNRVPVLPEFDWGSLVSTPELHQQLCAFACRQNKLDLIWQILEQSNDYNVLPHLKGILRFLDASRIVNFIQRTARTVSTETLMSTLDIFPIREYLLPVFSEIRSRPLMSIFAKNQFQKLGPALAKFSPKDLEDQVLTPFDNFALLCEASMNWSGRKKSLFCSRVASSTELTADFLFRFAITRASPDTDVIDTLLALIGGNSDKAIRVITAAAAFILAYENKQPFLAIRNHFEENPSDVTNEVILALAPSIFASSRFLTLGHIEILNGFADGEPAIKEIVTCVRLGQGSM